MMTQTLEKYYGVKLSASKTVELSKFLELEERIRSAIKATPLPSREHNYEIYVTRLLFSVTHPEVFGVGPLERRLNSVDLILKVNPKQIENKRLEFLNHKIANQLWSFTSEGTLTATESQIRAILSGRFCEHDGTFEILALTRVRSDLRQKDRKIKVTARATPTDSFRSKFRNISGIFSTSIDYKLNGSVQLALNLSEPVVAKTS